jgi:hypothetical protein
VSSNTLADHLAVGVGNVVLPWHSVGSVDLSEAFALRLHELTGCLIADRRNGRLIEPETLSGKKRAAV